MSHIWETTLIFCGIFILGIVIGVMLAVNVGSELFIRQGTHITMKEALERGHAVQCPGVTGYHWECDNDQ